MTDTKWTPGPWVYRPDRCDDWGVVKGSDGFVICQAKDHRFTDDEHLNNCRKDGVDPWLSVANLIAAAPELYEALACMISCEDAHHVMEANTLARAALAKARGET